MAERTLWHTQHAEPLGMDELYFNFVFEGEDMVCRVTADSAELCRDRTELIVRACNSHEELVRACRRAMTAIGRQSDFINKDGTLLERAWDSLSTALTKAEEV